MLRFMEVGPVPHAKTMESIGMFGKYVIPRFKGRTNWCSSQRQGQSKGAAASANTSARSSA